MLSYLSVAIKENNGKLIHTFSITAVMVRKHEDHKTLFNKAEKYFYQEEKARINLVTHGVIL